MKSGGVCSSSCGAGDRGPGARLNIAAARTHAVMVHRGMNECARRSFNPRATTCHDRMHDHSCLCSPRPATSVCPVPEARLRHQITSSRHANSLAASCPMRTRAEHPTPDEANARSLARARTQRPRDGAHFHVRKVQSDEPVTNISPAPTKTTHCTASEWPASCESDAPLSS